MGGGGAGGQQNEGLDLDFVLVVGDERTDEDMFDILQVGRKGGREESREEKGVVARENTRVTGVDLSDDVLLTAPLPPFLPPSLPPGINGLRGPPVPSHRQIRAGDTLAGQLLHCDGGEEDFEVGKEGGREGRGGKGREVEGVPPWDRPLRA